MGVFESFTVGCDVPADCHGKQVRIPLTGQISSDFAKADKHLDQTNHGGVVEKGESGSIAVLEPSKLEPIHPRLKLHVERFPIPDFTPTKQDLVGLLAEERGQLSAADIFQLTLLLRFELRPFGG